MRIRKQAKLAGIPISNAGSHSPAPIGIKCQLSRSPWHCLDSPLSSYQIGGEGDYTLDVSFWETVESFKSFSPMKLSCTGDSAFSDKSVKKAAFSGIEGLKLCAKTDGKSWKCKADVAEGNTMCQHHLDQLKSYNTTNNGNSITNVPSIRRKKRVSPSSDPYYYYAGFGRHARKLRGALAEHDDNIRPVVMEVEDRDKLEYIEKSDSDDDDVDGEGGKRWGRKPVKERSLKSLM